MRRLLHQIWSTRDLASTLFLLAIAAASAWCIALPLNERVQSEFLQRHHLASDSFAIWALQQPIPSIYSFENQYCLSRVALSPAEQATVWRELDSRTKLAEPLDCGELAHLGGLLDAGTLNHFPTRKVTFGDSRRMLNCDPDAFLYLSSRYRGRKIRSTYQMRPSGEATIQLRLLESHLE